jgi:2'-hydroxyisoflavone reductase
VARELRGRRLRILVLGGTLFLGRHLVEAGLARGHEVTLLNRGRTNPGLFPEVEKLRGDRDAGDLDALRGRSWESVVDTSGYVPRVVRQSAELLADAVEHYTFVSSLSVFTPPSKEGLSERDPVSTIEDETSEDVQAHYGPLKALCERAVEETVPGRVLNLRSGLLVGPHDPTSRFTYWVRRVARGGEILVPATVQPVQLVDVRDLARWTVELAERRLAGTLHATAPPIPFPEMLDACVVASGSDARLVAVEEDFLLEHGVEPFADLPLWLALGRNPDWRGFFLADVAQAVAHGLTFRPLEQTAADILASGDEAPGVKFGVDVPPAGMDPAREAEVLEAWKAAA